MQKRNKHRNHKEREDRVGTLVSGMAAKVFDLEPTHMKVVLIKRYARDEDGNRSDKITCDAFSQHPEATPQRELVWHGKNAKPITSKDQPFILFSRRDDLIEGGTALLLISDSKHGEVHQLALVFDKDLKVTGVRAEDILGNDFRHRVSKEANELGDLLNFDRIIHGVKNGSKN